MKENDEIDHFIQTQQQYDIQTKQNDREVAS